MYRTLRIVAYTFLIVTNIGAQTLTLDQREELRETLRREPDRPEYVETLIALLTSSPDMETLSSDLDEFSTSVSTERERIRLYFEVGSIYETANRFDDAARWYARVLELDPENWSAILRRAAMSIELGEAAEAVVLLGRVVQRAPTRALQRQAAILRARAYFVDREYQRALRHARALVGEGENIEPMAAYLLHEVAMALDDTDSIALARRVLEERAPNSPEYALLEGDVSVLPSPSRLFPSEYEIETPAPVIEEEQERVAIVRAIQVGSFRDRENAEYMKLDVENAGFAAAIERHETEAGVFHRVLVPVSRDAGEADVQELVLGLKERGIEGILLFE